MEPFVLDSSFALAWCFSDERTARTDEVRGWLLGTYAVTLPLWKWEVTNGLLVAHRRKRISADDVRDALRRFAALPIRIDPDRANVASASLFDLAQLHALTGYDTSYLELAQRLQLPLATLDQALANAATKAGVKVL